MNCRCSLNTVTANQVVIFACSKRFSDSYNAICLDWKKAVTNHFCIAEHRKGHGLCSYHLSRSVQRMLYVIDTYSLLSFFRWLKFTFLLLFWKNISSYTYSSTHHIKQIGRWCFRLKKYLTWFSNKTIFMIPTHIIF